MKILLGEEYNPNTKMTTKYWSHDGKITIQVFQDVENHLTSNTREYDSISTKSKSARREGLGERVASIPFAVVEKLMRERGLNVLTCSDDQLRRLLNDSEFQKLRTRPCKL